jgi:hypothetical protein
MAQPVDVEVGNKVVAPVEREKDEAIVRTMARYFNILLDDEILMEER